MFASASTWRKTREEKGSCGVWKVLAEILSVVPSCDSISVGWWYPLLPASLFLWMKSSSSQLAAFMEKDWRVRNLCVHVCVCVCVPAQALCGCEVCLYWGCELLSVVIPSGGKANWFASCSPMFDPAACSAVSLFGNLWHADDRAILMRVHTWQVFTESEHTHTTHTNTHKNCPYNYIQTAVLDLYYLWLVYSESWGCSCICGEKKTTSSTASKHSSAGRHLD